MARSAQTVFAELTDRRDCGVVHAGIVEARDLTTAAAAFGLRDGAMQRGIDIEEARRVLITVLHRDLAYGVELMARADAERLASDVLAFAPASRFFTNGTYGVVQPGDGHDVNEGISWAPATSATFDTGVVAVGSTTSMCVWVEDED